MVLQIFGHRFAGIETRFDLRVSYITAYDDGTVERETCTDRIFGKDGTHIFHRLVEVDTDGIAFTGLTEFGGDERSRIVIQFLDPDTVFVDFAFDVTVGRA